MVHNLQHDPQVWKMTNTNIVKESPQKGYLVPGLNIAS